MFCQFLYYYADLLQVCPRQVSYVLDTEDFLFRKKKRTFHQNGPCHNQARVSNGYPIRRLQRFQRWLSGS